jgi:hypothetical protein
MYTLRIIEEIRKDKKSPFVQVIRNIGLGDSYLTCTAGSQEFDEIISKYPEDSEIRKIVIDSKHTERAVLLNNEHRNYTYFIMTENGKTFERL